MMADRLAARVAELEEAARWLDRRAASFLSDPQRQKLRKCLGHIRDGSWKADVTPPEVEK